MPGEVARALELLREAPMSTGLTEKAHRHGKFLSRYHRRLSASNLRLRSLLGDAVVMFRRTQSEIAAAKLNTQLDSLLSSQKGSKFTGRHAFMQMLLARLPIGSRRGANHRLAAASHRFNGLREEERAMWAQVAMDKNRFTEGQSSAVASVLRDMHLMQLREHRHFWGDDVGVRNCMDSARFSIEEVFLAAIWWQERNDICQVTPGSTTCPRVGAPSDDIMAALSDKIRARPRLKSPVPWWAAVMMKQKDYFLRSAVCKLDAADPFPLVIYVLQVACVGRQYCRFLECIRKYEAEEGDAQPHAMATWATCIPRYTPTARYLASQDVPLDEEEDSILLCLDVTFCDRDVVFSIMVPIDERIASLPQQPPRAQEPRDGPARQPRISKRAREALAE